MQQKKRPNLWLFTHKGQSLSGMILQLKGLLLHNEGTAEKPQWRSNKKVREVGYHIFSHTHETVEQLNKKRFQLAHASQEFMKEKLAEFTQKRFVPARTLPAFLPGSAAFRLDGWKHNGTWEPSDDFLGRSLKHDVPKDEDPEKFKDRFVEFVRSNLYIQRSCRDFFDRDTSGALFEAIGYSCYPCVFDEKQVPAAMMQMFFAGSTHRFHLVMKDGLCSNLLNLFFLT
ncbi:hypothetical protein OAN22_02185 [Alphaproteobacteria bacterium]|nr:hypothetical protein [Alphaproteobacteria bacterium]